MADDVCAKLTGLIAYLCALALVFIVGVYLGDQLPEMHTGSPARPDWTLASRSTPAFASDQHDLSYKTKSYRILRHPEGGRKDVLRWNAENGRPIALLEIYRPGGEFEPPAASDGAGVIDSKFGPVTLLHRNSDGCLGFLKTIDRPFLRMSGFACQGETVPAQGAAVACLLNRLSPIAAGNDALLAELFARADLKLAGCRTDWVSAPGRPALRGAI